MADNNLAVKRSVARVVLLSILTMGLYGLYWFYATRVQMTKELGTEDNAGWQTVGLIVPILNWFIIYWLWRDIDKAQKKAGLDGFSAGGFLGVVIAAQLLGWIPFLGWALAIGAIVVYCLVVSKVNEYWDKQTGNKATEAPLKGGEAVVVIIGVALLILTIIAAATGALTGGATTEINNDLYNSTYSY